MKRKDVAWGLVQLAVLGITLAYTYDHAAAFFRAWDEDRPLQWWAGRATGFAAFGAMALSMVFGLLISSRGLDGAVARKTVTTYHQEWTLAALAVTLAHVVVIAADEYAEIGLEGALVPGHASQLTAAVALGTVAFWLMLVVVLSSWARGLMPYSAWRAIHAAATAVFILGLAHGVLAGTDTEYQFARLAYATGGALVLGGTCFRLLHEPARRGGSARAAAPASGTSSPRERPQRLESPRASTASLAGSEHADR